MNKTEKPGILYLACPFTHNDPAEQEYRYKTSCRVAAKLIKHGLVVFNPLSHSVPIVPYLGEDVDPHSTWMSIDIPILQRCDELLILGLPQWEQSRGVREEMFKALGFHMPITLIDENDIPLLPQVKKSSRRFLKSAFLPVVDDVA